MREVKGESLAGRVQKRRSQTSRFIALVLAFPLTSHLSPLTFACYTPPKKQCPDGTHRDPSRATEVFSLVEIEGDALLCFGEQWPSRVITSGVYLLDERASIEETAAKLAHLNMHQREAERFDTLPTKKEDCAAWVDGLLILEAKAYAAELRLRKKLRVQTNPYEFEAAFWESPQQEEVILSYLRSHPEGGGGVDALGAAYLERCKRGSAQQTP